MQSTRQILIIDDEDNIRLTLKAALSPLGFALHEAISGEGALATLERSPFDLVLLDLHMPGIGGIEVLRRARAKHPTIRFIIVTAHGTIESAVEAMKLGAVDFIQKPCTPHDIRELVGKVLERETLDEAQVGDYATLIELCKRHVTDRNLEQARAVAQRAVGLDPGKPDAYNLLGAFLECRGEWVEAQKYYRAALEIDPSYLPAKANLTRTASMHKSGKIQIGE
jgi:DNA-binding NtrC family response regulator